MRRVLPVALALVAAACKKSPPPPSPEAVEATDAPPTIAAPPRCAPVSPDAPFVLGPEDTGRADAAGQGPDDILPFAVEVGDGVAYEGGFAVGVLHESESKLAFSVVTLDKNGKNAKIVPLGITHGDVDPPRLAAQGATLAAGVLEPDANGRSLRLAKIANGAVTWGATLHEQPDESQAYDIALGDKKGIVVWDEDTTSSSVIQVSTVDAATLANATPPRTISRAAADAESPRLAPRPSGYWLAYVARAAATPSPEAGIGDFVMEDIGYGWIEVVPLDANGSPTGPARAATPRDGHVMVYDLAPTPDGGVLLVYRWLDAPAGAAGGEVMRVVVHPTSIEAPTALVREDVGAGAPNLLPGWLALLSSADTTRLGPISAIGELDAPLNAEPDIGAGEPVAASGSRLLVSRPAGRAVKLVVLECHPDADAGGT